MSNFPFWSTLVKLRGRYKCTCIIRQKYILFFQKISFHFIWPTSSTNMHITHIHTHILTRTPDINVARKVQYLLVHLCVFAFRCLQTNNWVTIMESLCECCESEWGMSREREESVVYAFMPPMLLQQSLVEVHMYNLGGKSSQY